MGLHFCRKRFQAVGKSKPPTAAVHGHAQCASLPRPSPHFHLCMNRLDHLRLHTPPQLAMMRSRLFSTLQRLQHENPLVSLANNHVESPPTAKQARPGPSALWRTSADAAHAARTAQEARHQRRQEDRRRVVGKGRRRQEHHCWYGNLRHL